MRFLSSLQTLGRHKTIVVLMVLSATLTIAVVGNTAHIVTSKWRVLDQPSGLDEDHVVVVQAHDFDATGAPGPRQQALLAKLRAQADVESVAIVGTMAFMNDMADALATQASGGGPRAGASFYSGSPTYLEALNVRIVAGEGFDATDFVPFDDGNGLERVAAILLTQDLARRLFGTDAAVGRVVYLSSGQPVVVKAVTANVLRPNPALRSPADNALTAFVPVVPEGRAATFVLRTRKEASALVAPSRSIVENAEGDWSVERAATLKDVRAAFFAHESDVVDTLLFGSAALLAATVAGLSGLSGYWVAQRRRSIGIRRAIGATRGYIVSHFLFENTVVMGIAVIVGTIVAFALGHILSTIYDLQPLTWRIVALSSLGMVVLGWLTVLKPAIGASRMPPREAMGT